MGNPTCLLPCEPEAVAPTVPSPPESGSSSDDSSSDDVDDPAPATPAPSNPAQSAVNDNLDSSGDEALSSSDSDSAGPPEMIVSEDSGDERPQVAPAGKYG